MAYPLACRLLGECPTSILFCGADQWAPTFHMEDLLALQSDSTIPSNIDMTYLGHLRHDFIVHPKMVGDVVNYCVDAIEVDGLNKIAGVNIRSRL